MLGATGSGKSFTLNFLLVEALKYNPRVLILDLGGSYRWLTRFVGGRYLELSPGEAEPTLRLQPFALPATTRSFQFLTGWVLRLLKLGGWEATGAATSEIRARIEDLYAFEPERRTLGVLAASLPSETWPAWSRWIGSGAWGAYFDNPAGGAPDLDFADWQVIDLAGAVEHPDLCDAALSYLLERMRLEVEDPAETARLKLMVVDEAWRYLQDPAVLNYLAEAAKTWRKKNAALVLATQSAVDVTATPGAAALLESIPTKLFLANPELPDAVGELFRLNELGAGPGPGPDPQTRALPPPPGRGGGTSARGRSGELLALHLVRARRRREGPRRRTPRARPGHRGARKPRPSHPQHEDMTRHAIPNDTHRSTDASPGGAPGRGRRAAGG